MLREVNSSNSLRIVLALSTIAISSTVTFFFKYLKRSRRLVELPGPPNPSFITGHYEDLGEAKCGTCYNEWRREYGKTYRLYAPFGVCTHSISIHPQKLK